MSDYRVFELVVWFECECGNEALFAINSTPDFGIPFTCKCGKVYLVDYKIEVKQVNE